MKVNLLFDAKIFDHKWAHSFNFRWAHLSEFQKLYTNTFFVVLSGKATSNTFDNEKVLDETTVLKGVNQRSDIGLLSLFEHYDSILVGDNLKNPSLPIWLVCAESHFTVLFGLTRGLERTSLADRKPIDLLYYDQLSKVQVCLKNSKFIPLCRSCNIYLSFMLWA